MDKPIQGGEILSRALSVWARNVAPFTVLAGIVYSPLIVVATIALGSGLDPVAFTWFQRLDGIVSLVLSMILTGSLSYAVFEELSGRHATAAESLRVGLRRLAPVLATGLTVGVLVFLGLVALIVPGLILLCMLWLAVPVAVVERVGAIEAMRRSRDLTEGARMQIFGIILAVGVVQTVIAAVLVLVFIGGEPTPDTVGIWLLISAGVALVFGSIQAVANVVAYHHIRRVKEGVDVEELAAVFR